MTRHLRILVCLLLGVFNTAGASSAVAERQWAGALVCAALAGICIVATAHLYSLAKATKPAPAGPSPRVPLAWRYEWFIQRFYERLDPMGPVFLLGFALWLAAGVVIFVTADYAEVG